MSSTTIPVRESLKILLLNPAQELLLICYDDPATTSVGKKSKGRFWTPVGGKIEEVKYPNKPMELDLGKSA